MENTFKVAQKIVEFLQEGFNERKFNVPSIKNVYITGSFVRGDWLNMSSDLDIQVLFYKDSDDTARKKDLNILQSAVCGQFGKKPFFSQAMNAPFGLDWSISDYLPQNTEDILNVSPFVSYNVFYFDFYKNKKIIYGDDFTNDLPKVVDVKPIIKEAIKFITQRMSESHMYKDNRKCAYAAYKIAVMLQLYFGELDLDKRKILSLYEDNVPDFEEKHYGEFIIRNYIGSFYPDREPVFFNSSKYIDFAKASLKIINNTLP